MFFPLAISTQELNTSSLFPLLLAEKTMCYLLSDEKTLQALRLRCDDEGAVPLSPPLFQCRRLLLLHQCLHYYP